MKACNFAYLDPSCDGKGLWKTGAADRSLWQEYAGAPELLLVEMQQVVSGLDGVELNPEPSLASGTETLQLVKRRRNQRQFRQQLLEAYSSRCALTGLREPALLIASHIIPWAVDEDRRLDPSNGLLLQALVDRAFDEGLVTFDERLRLLCSRRLTRGRNAHALLDLEGAALAVPNEHPPSSEALRWHRETWFVDARHDSAPLKIRQRGSHRSLS